MPSARVLLLGLGACFASPGCEEAVQGEDAPTWSVVREDLGGALLSLWIGPAAGASKDMGQIMVSVGADDGSGPYVLERLSPSSDLARLDTGYTGNLWWVTADPQGTMWMVGDKGLLLRHPPGGGFERIEVPTELTLSGIWFASPDRGFIVGGDIFADPAQGEPRGVLLTLDGDTWAEAQVPPGYVGDDLLFKVWGRHATDVWVVGEHGVVLHLDEQGWQRVQTPSSARFVTVHGNRDIGPFVVGGANSPVILEFADGAFQDLSDKLDGTSPGLNGVFCPPNFGPIVVGNQGYLGERDPDGNWSVPPRSGTSKELHAVAVDSGGGVWAVGGNLFSSALDGGVLLHYGPALTESGEE